jgi:hypothetical protein
MQTVIIVLGLITLPVLLLVNWMLWFHLLPTVFRQLRDQYRRIRERKRPT